jgi:PHP-associated
MGEDWYPPPRVPGRGAGWYRGDCHVHSTISGWELTPEQLAVAARGAGLDFLATTEHNTAAGHRAWQPWLGEDLLVILGQEVTTRTGHWLALGVAPGQTVEHRYGVEDGVIDEHLAAVHADGGLCVAAHPHAPYPTGAFGYSYQGFDAVEVWNGAWRSDVPWQADNEAALADWARALVTDVPTGRWRPAIGNSDVHFAGQIGTAQLVVWAEELGAAAVLDAIRAGRCWVAESAQVRLSLSATAGDTSAGIGGCLRTGGEPVTVRVEVGGVPSCVVALHTDDGLVCQAIADGAGSAELLWHTTAERSAFARVEVRHPEGAMAALTNPVILAG